MEIFYKSNKAPIPDNYTRYEHIELDDDLNATTKNKLHKNYI